MKNVLGVELATYFVLSIVFCTLVKVASTMPLQGEEISLLRFDMLAVAITAVLVRRVSVISQG